MDGLNLTNDEVVKISSYLNSLVSTDSNPLDKCPTVDIDSKPPSPPELQPKPETEPELESSTFTSMLKVKHSSKCLDIRGESKATGAKAIQYRCDNSYENQSFKFLPVAGKEQTYKIRAKHSGLCLAVADNSQQRATQIIQNTCSNNKLNQQFSLHVVDASEKSFEVRAVHSGQCLDVYGEEQADSANIIQWPCENAENQQWKLNGFIQ
jgi:agarase